MVTTSNLSHAFRASYSSRFGSFFAGILLFLTALTSQAATVLYSHNFNGAATALNGTAVNGGTQTANWSASSTFSANGSVAATNGSALLPFAPTAGNIYELSGTINVTNTVGWIGLGFANATSAWMTSPTNSDFTTAATTGGFSWIINQYTTPTSQQQDRFLGSATTNPLTKGTTVTGQPLTFKIVLNTTGTQWTTEFYINGVKNGATGTYTTNPTINSIGFTTNSTAIGSISDFQLVAVPEPSKTALLMSCGIIVLFRRRRR